MTPKESELANTLLPDSEDTSFDIRLEKAKLFARLWLLSAAIPLFLALLSKKEI